MKAIKVRPTVNTPAVVLDPSRAVFKMYGRSSPENSLRFYEPVKDALASCSSLDRLDVRIKMEYFNTSSSKCIYDVLKEIKALKEKGTNIRVRWYYDQYDEDMMEAGEDYSSLLDIPFSIIELLPEPRKAS